MSTSSLYLIFPNRLEELALFRNSHGTAPALWSHLCREYLGRDECAWLSAGDWLWQAARDPAIPLHFRIAHAFTFDLALCPPRDWGRLSDACLLVGEALASARQGSVNHWSGIGIAVGAAKAGSDCLGIGLGATSICDPWEEPGAEGSLNPLDLVDGGAS